MSKVKRLELLKGLQLMGRMKVGSGIMEELGCIIIGDGYIRYGGMGGGVIEWRKDLGLVRGGDRVGIRLEVLSKVLGRMGCEEVEIEVGGDMVKIRGEGGYKADVELVKDVSNHPLYNYEGFNELSGGIGIDVRRFSDGIRLSCVSIDVNNAREVLKGLRIEGDGKEMRLMGTDGKRCSYVGIEYSGDEVKRTIGGDGIGFMMGIVNESDRVEMYMGGGIYRFSVGGVDWYYSIEGVEGEYPDLRKILDMGVEYEVKIKVKELNDAFNFVSVLFKDRSEHINMLIKEGGEIWVKTDDGKLERVVKCEVCKGGFRERLFSFQGSYIMEVVKELEGMRGVDSGDDEVIYGFNEGDGPVKLSNSRLSGYVVMPIKRVSE